MRRVFIHLLIMRKEVSFEKLTKIGTLIKKQDLAMDDAKQIIHIAKKIDGTEMMGLLESSTSSASQKKLQPY